jgi:hypothetical protein
MLSADDAPHGVYDEDHQLQIGKYSVEVSGGVHHVKQSVSSTSAVPRVTPYAYDTGDACLTRQQQQRRCE